MSTRAKAQAKPDAPTSKYWEYMLESDKKPTKQLHMLLTAIAKHITDNLGPKDEKKLSPNKLAAFYKAVGGNYDTLFVDIPHPSISYIYQSIGCQHTLQPTANDFAEPSIPALTIRGFVRWETIETLLQPEEHVPYLQHAVKHFGLRHPETGELYPTDMPADVFPLVADEDIERWHTDCAERLKKRALPDDEQADTPRSRPGLPPRPDIRSGFTHIHRHDAPMRSPNHRQEGADYFDRPGFQHVPRGFTTTRPPQSRSANARSTHLAQDDSSSESRARSRRRSVPENHHYPNSSTTSRPPVASTVHPDLRAAKAEAHARGHSHPRNSGRNSSVRPSSSSSSSDESSQSDVEASPPLRTRKTPPRETLNHLRYGTSNVRDSVSASPRMRASTFTKDPRLEHMNIPIVDHKGRQINAENVSRSGSRGSTTNPRYRDGQRESQRGSAENVSHLSQVSDRDRDKIRREDRPRLSSVRSGSHDGKIGTRDRLERFRERDREFHTDRDERDPREVRGEDKKKVKRRWW